MRGPSSTVLLAAAYAWLAGCVSGGVASGSTAPAAPTAHPVQSIFPPGSALASDALIASHGTGHQAYALTSAQWLAGVPVAVNEDYDFGMAMGLDAGPGIAAGKRLRANREKAALLAGFNLSRKTLEALDGARARGVHVYVLLWGPAEDAEARVVTDRFDRRGRLVDSAFAVLPQRPLTGSKGWSSARDAIERAIGTALSAAPSVSFE